MKKFLLVYFLFLYFCFSGISCFAEQSFANKKKEIIALYNSNNLEEAYNMISKITEDERDYEIWYILGNLAQDFNNDTNAAFYLQKSIVMKPDFDKAHYNLGNIYLKEKKYNSAINEYKLAIKYNGNFAYYYYNLGCAYFEQKNYKDAKSAFQKAIKYKPTEADFYYNLAVVCNCLGKDKEKKSAFEKYNSLKKEI